MPFEKGNKLAVKHGAHGTPEYVTWCNMKARCCDPNHPRYAEWGGRGIAVCSRWIDSFETFLSDVGQKPFPNYSLDRIDGNLGYQPGNVRWASAQQQSENRRDFNRMITHEGKTQCLSAWAKELGVNRKTLSDRLDKGILFEQAIKGGIQPESLAQSNSEHAHQTAFFCWMAQNFNLYPQLQFCFAIPNGGERNKITAAVLKAEGVRPGVPDVFLPVAVGNWHGLFIEFKRPKTEKQSSGRLSEKQIEWSKALKDQNYGYVVAFTWEQARDFVVQYLTWKD